MERELVEVVATEDHLCGRCTKLIPAGSNALKGRGEMFDGHWKEIKVEVYYHNPSCRPYRPQQIREPRIDPSVAKKERGRRWRNQS